MSHFIFVPIGGVRNGLVGDGIVAMKKFALLNVAQWRNFDRRRIAMQLLGWISSPLPMASVGERLHTNSKFITR
jgi:hypothetical protein